MPQLSITVRYFAGARAAAGRASEQVRLDGAPTVAALLSALTELRGPGLAGVLPACSFLLDGRAVHDRQEPLPDGAEFDVLPPFAGG